MLVLGNAVCHQHWQQTWQVLMAHRHYERTQADRSPASNVWLLLAGMPSSCRSGEQHQEDRRVPPMLFLAAAAFRRRSPAPSRVSEGAYATHERAPPLTLKASIRYTTCVEEI